MNRLRLAAPALAFLAAACAQAPPTPPAPPPVEWPWPRVAGSDGRSALQLQTILRNAAPTTGGDGTWQIQGQVEHDDPAVLLSDLHATIRVTTDDGVERVFGREKSNLDAAHRSVVVWGLELGAHPARIAALDFELHLVRPKTWTTKTESLDRLGAVRNVVVSPFEFALAAREHAITVSAWSTDESLAAGPPRAVADLLSHRWAACAAEVLDAAAVEIRPMGSAGSGGATTCSFVSPVGLRYHAPEYPVSVTLRVPDAVDTEVVRYRFTDLDLSSVPRRL